VYQLLLTVMTIIVTKRKNLYCYNLVVALK